MPGRGDFVRCKRSYPDCVGCPAGHGVLVEKCNAHTPSPPCRDVPHDWWILCRYEIDEDGEPVWFGEPRYKCALPESDFVVLQPRYVDVGLLPDC